MPKNIYHFIIGKCIPFKCQITFVHLLQLRSEEIWTKFAEFMALVYYCGIFGGISRGIV